MRALDTVKLFKRVLIMYPSSFERDYDKSWGSGKCPANPQIPDLTGLGPGFFEKNMRTKAHGRVFQIKIINVTWDR